MRVKITVDAWADVPDNTNLTAFAMALQDSPAVLDEHLQKAGYEVIVHRMRASEDGSQGT